MKITIIGWYGTETIGDRAILAGLFHLFGASYGNFEVRLGCLDTLLSERTLDDDGIFFRECANGQLIDVSLFDSRKKSELNVAIAWSDIVVIGGGPLMELDAMYMLLYAFKKAKQHKRKCIVAGCGMGPFKTERLKNVATQLADLADIVIFRDSKSQDIYHQTSSLKKDTLALIDPAAIASQCYLDKYHTDKTDDYIAINFREPPVNEYDGLGGLRVEYFAEILKNIVNSFAGEIRLVPMHTFSIGGDDRYFLNKVARISELPNIKVYNRPLSLKETMAVYHQANCCVGMRFHAVLLQTFLNGRNFILDYTDPTKGKIINLLNLLSLREAFGKKYISLINRPPSFDFDIPVTQKVTVNNKQVMVVRNSYIQSFKSIL